MAKKLSPVMIPLLVLAACAGKDDGTTGETSENANPAVLISSPADGAVLSTSTVTFIGRASDPENGPKQLQGGWAVDGAELCGPENLNKEGISTCSAELSAGAHTITLVVVDLEGGVGEASIDVVVEDENAPVVDILTPDGSIVYYEDAEVEFTGLATDVETASPDLEIRWESSIDGEIDVDSAADADGSLAGSLFLSEGLHNLTLTATDTDGLSASDSVEIRVGVANRAPDCAILAPEHGDSTDIGSLVEFEGEGSDRDIDPEYLTASWSSDLDGDLHSDMLTLDGETTFSLDTLTLGTHQITLLVTDEYGLDCEDTILFTVGTPPEADIVLPTDGTVVNEGDLVDFEGLISDGEQVPHSLVVAWSSDLDGNLDTTGAPDLGGVEGDLGTVAFTAPGLSIGTHTITLRATDEDGMYDEDYVSLVVNDLASAPEVSLTPDPAGTDDALTVSVDVDAVDLEGDTLTYVYAWSRNGTVTAQTTATYDAVDHARGDVIEVMVAADDGYGLGDYGIASITISNSVPVADVPVLTPDPASETDTLTCTAGATSDGDGDTVTVSYGWLVDGIDIGVTTDTLTGDDFSRGETVVCQVTPNDGADDGLTVDSNAVVIGNAAGEVSDVVITPDPATTSDALTCAWTWADADGDGDSSTVSWSVNGAVVGTGTTLTSGYVHLDEVMCTVTANDGTDDGNVESASLIISNTAPELATLVLSPDPASTDDDFTCTPGTTSDADGEAVSLTYAWTINGTTAAETSATLSASLTSSGDDVTCWATPSDGTDVGATVESNSVVVSNTPPEVDSISLSPSSPTTDDTLTATVTSSDADGDAVTLTYTWYVNGSAVTSGTDSTLDGTVHFGSGDLVYVVVQPSDGIDVGTDATSSTVTIDNTAGVVSSASITPDPATASDGLTCAWTWTDDDGDADASTVAWTVNGTAAGTGTTLTSGYVHNDVVVCTVTANDGSTTGNTTSASLTISNTAPVLAAVTLTPDPAATSDDFTCTPGSASDDDGETVSYSYAWTVDGSAVSETSATLSSSATSSGDTVQCTVTPSDGTDSGTAVASNAVTVNNSAPVMTTVTLSPASPTTDETITATAAATDSDGDSISYDYKWYVNGTLLLSGATATLNGNLYFDKGDTVYVVVTPTDGTDAGTSLTSSTVTIANFVGEVSSVNISPSPAYAANTLTCAWTWSDDDGDADVSTVAWTVNGTSAGTGTTLTSGYVNTDVVVCTVTADDGTDVGASSSATLTISNTPPVLSTVTLTPDPADTSDSFTCTPGSSSDADGETVSYTYTWTVDGTTVSETSSTLSSSSTSSGDTVQCTVTPNDGTDDGTVVASNSVTVDNAAPVMASVSLSPTSPTTDETITASASATDGDGDTITYDYAWYVNGTQVRSGATATLSGTLYFDKGDTVYVVVTPSDGTDDGASLTSSTLTVDNIVGDVTSVTISPDPAYAADALTCSWTWSDADGDSDSSTVAWTVDGASAGTGTTLSSGFSNGEVVVCTVTPNDGVDVGTPVTDSLTVSNTVPVVASASISPSSPTTASDLTCSAGATSDDDGESVSLSYAWTVDGSASSETSATLSASEHSKGDVVACTITPNDGTDDGASVTSASVTIDNTAPSIASVSITPSPLGTEDQAFASVSGAADLDGDSIFYTYTWVVNGTTVQSGADAYLDGATEFDRTDTVRVTVTPTDGVDAGASVASSTVTVANTLPTAPVVSIDPGAPEPGEDDLYCDLVANATDDDGDTLTYSVTWYLSGVEWTGATTTTTWTDDTILAAQTTHGDSWQCVMVANDGYGDGDSGDDTVGVYDLTGPDAPTIALPLSYVNNADITFSGTCDYADYASMTLVCENTTDGVTSTATTCASDDTWEQEVTSIARGVSTTCYAYGTDVYGNDSSSSSSVSTQVCEVEDVYELVSGYGDTDTDPVDEWSVLDDATGTLVNIEGNILQDDSDVIDWYVIDASDVGSEGTSGGIDTFNFDVALLDPSTGALSTDYQMTVYRDTVDVTGLQCALTGYTEYDWYTQDVSTATGHTAPGDDRYCANGTTYNECQDDSATFYLAVSRVSSGVTSCAAYELEISNGL